MNTRFLLTFTTMLLLTGAIPQVASDPVPVANELSGATACDAECMRKCQRRGGTLDQCSDQCYETSKPGRKTRSDPYCVRECMAGGNSRAVCERRCSSTERTGPSKPEFPAPTRPPGT